MSMHRVGLAASVVALILAGAARADWPGYRGPDQEGRIKAGDTPTSWSESKNVAWKLQVPGKAWSTPVIWGDQIWITNADADGKQLDAWVIDKNTGKVLKKLELHKNPDPQYCHPFNSYASPSPAIEDGRVYITFGSPWTGCIDTKTFEVLWSRTDFKCNHFRGAGSSPVIFEDKLLMNFDGSDYQYVVALDKKTGKTLWKTDRSVDFQDINPKTGKPDRDGDWRKGFSTPLVRDFGNGPVFLSLGSKAFYAYDPNTGKERWRVEFPKSHSGSSRPIVGKNLIYICTGARGDLLAIKPGGKGVVTDSHVAWMDAKNVPFKPSPLLAGNVLYTVDDKGIFTCRDARTGETLYKERVAGAKRSSSTFSASPILVGKKIYLFDEEGHGTVVAHGPKFKIIGNGTLDAGFLASPAVDGDALILRTKTHLYRIESK